MSLATVGVATCCATSGMRVFATFSMICAYVYTAPNDPLVSFAAFWKFVATFASSGSVGKVNIPGVVKPMPAE